MEINSWLFLLALVGGLAVSSVYSLDASLSSATGPSFILSTDVRVGSIFVIFNIHSSYSIRLFLLRWQEEISIDMTMIGFICEHGLTAFL